MNPSSGHLPLTSTYFFDSNAGASDSQPKEQQRGKRRAASRAATKRSIRILSTDTSNFRDMVQMLTGIPSATDAAASSSFLMNSDRHCSTQLSERAMAYGNEAAAELPRSMPTIDTSSAYLRMSYDHGRHGSTAAVSAAAAENRERRHQQLWQEDRSTSNNSASSTIAATTTTTGGLCNHYAVTAEEVGKGGDQGLPSASIVAHDPYRPVLGGGGDFESRMRSPAADRRQYGGLGYITEDYYPPRAWDWYDAQGASATETPAALFGNSSSWQLLEQEYGGRVQRVRQAAELERLLMADDVVPMNGTPKVIAN